MGLFDGLFAGDGEDAITATQLEAAVCALAFVGLVDGVLTLEEQDELSALVGSTPWARDLDRDEVDEIAVRAVEKAASFARAPDGEVAERLRELGESLVEPNLCERVLGMAALVAVSEEGAVNEDEQFALFALAAAFGIPDRRARGVIESALVSGAA